jgi:hypothetical protein
MKKIEKEMLRAILEGRSWRKSNTHVQFQNGWARVFLFGNLIAQVDTKTDTVYISTGGWRTITTKNRLNAILMHFTNYKVFQKDFLWYIGDISNKMRAYWGYDYASSVLKVTYDSVSTTDGGWPAMFTESQFRLREIERMKNSCEANFKRIKRAAAKRKTLWNNPIFA